MERVTTADSYSSLNGSGFKYEPPSAQYNNGSNKHSVNEVSPASNSATIYNDSSNRNTGYLSSKSVLLKRPHSALEVINNLFTVKYWFIHSSLYFHIKPSSSNAPPPLTSSSSYDGRLLRPASSAALSQTQRLPSPQFSSFSQQSSSSSNSSNNNTTYNNTTSSGASSSSYFQGSKPVFTPLSRSGFGGIIRPPSATVINTLLLCCKCLFYYSTSMT